jgi:hypothetical protein
VIVLCQHYLGSEITIYAGVAVVYTGNSKASFGPRVRLATRALSANRLVLGDQSEVQISS